MARHELLCFVALATVLALSFALAPSPQGFGTHTQLGLPPCPTMALFHVRCPACGLTTSFAACTHGQWMMAWRAHPAGPLLWLATFGAAAYFGCQAFTRRRFLAPFSSTASSNILFRVFIFATSLGVLREVWARVF